MKIIKNLELFLIAFSQKVPLEIFVIVGSLLEEIIAPIPSPLVMLTVGSFAQAQGRGFGYLIYIGFLAAASKTIGCWFFYFLGDRAEDFISQRFGKIIGFSHQEIENIGRVFDGTKKDDFILAIIRAIPIMPTTPVSLACGFIKMDLFSYLRSTFIGNFIRGMLFGYIGYSGLLVLLSLINGINTLESLMNIVIVLVLVGLLGAVYYKRRKGDFYQWLRRKKRIS